MWKLSKYIPKIFTDTPDIHGRIIWWFWWVPFVAVPAIIGWLSSSLPWFWHWFGMAGVALVTLVSAMILVVMAAAYRHYKMCAPASRTSKTNECSGSLSLVDSNTKRLAGLIVQIGEVVTRPHFLAFPHMSTDADHFMFIMQSSHPIWSNGQALQLRRDFENQIGRIAEANKERDLTERQQATSELRKTIESLSKILLGQT